MTVSPVFSQIVPAYAETEPYITPDDYLAAGTGTDISQLIPGGGLAATTAALAGIIARVSSDCDNFVQKSGLAATIDVQTAPPEGWRIQNRGGRQVIQVPVDGTPLIAVTGVALSRDVATAPVAWTDLTGVTPARKVATIPVGGTWPIPSTLAPYAAGGRLWGSVSYISGYFNSTLAASVSAGATSLTVVTPTGLYPGLSIPLYDTAAAHDEPNLMVGAGYVYGSTTVPLAAPLAYAHAAGCSVSALPPSVRDAVILWTTAKLKRRGAGAMVISTAGGEIAVQGDPGKADEAEAKSILQSLKRSR